MHNSESKSYVLSSPKKFAPSERDAVVEGNPKMFVDGRGIVSPRLTHTSEVAEELDTTITMPLGGFNVTPPRSAARQYHPQPYLPAPEMGQSLSPSRPRPSQRAPSNVTPTAAVPSSTISVNDIREDQEIEEAWSRFQARTSDAVPTSPHVTSSSRREPIPTGARKSPDKQSHREVARSLSSPSSSSSHRPSPSRGESKPQSNATSEALKKKLQREAYERSIAEQERKRKEAQDAYNRSVLEQQQERERREATTLLQRKNAEAEAAEALRRAEAARIKAEEDEWLRQQREEAEAITSASSSEELEERTTRSPTSQNAVSRQSKSSSSQHRDVKAKETPEKPTSASTNRRVDSAPGNESHITEKEQLRRKVELQRKQIALQKRQEEIEEAERLAEEAKQREILARQRAQKEAVLRSRLEEQRQQRVAAEQEAARRKDAARKEALIREQEERKERAVEAERMRQKLLERDRAQKRAARLAEQEREREAEEKEREKKERLRQRLEQIQRKKELKLKKQEQEKQRKENRLASLREKQAERRARLARGITGAEQHESSGHDDSRDDDVVDSAEEEDSDIASQQHTRSPTSESDVSDKEKDAVDHVTDMRATAEHVLFNEEEGEADTNPRFMDSYYSSGDDAPSMDLSAFGADDDDGSDTDMEKHLFQSYVDGLDAGGSDSDSGSEPMRDEPRDHVPNHSPGKTEPAQPSTPARTQHQNFIDVPEYIMKEITNPSSKLPAPSPGLSKNAPPRINTDLYDPSPVHSARKTFVSPRIQGNSLKTPPGSNKGFERFDIGESERLVPPKRLQKRLEQRESDRKERLAAKKKRDEARAAEAEFKKIEAEQKELAKREWEQQDQQRKQRKHDLMKKKEQEFVSRQEQVDRKAKARKRQAQSRNQKQNDSMMQYASENRGYADLHTADAAKEDGYSVQDSLTMRDLEHELSRLNNKIDANLEKDIKKEVKVNVSLPPPSSARPQGRILGRGHFASQKKPLMVKSVVKKSNSKLIANALRFVCLAGEVHKSELRDSLEAIKRSEWPHYMILFKEQGGNQVYRAVYGLDLEQSSCERVAGDGPADPFERPVLHRYRYDSGHKRFDRLNLETFTPIVDAFSLRRSKPAKSAAPDPGRHTNRTSNTTKRSSAKRTKKKSSEEDSRRSNRKVIQNALTFNCLAGAINAEERAYALQEINAAPGEHFLVMFKKRGGNMVYRAVYVWDSVRGIKVYGDGPDYIEESMIASYYKYNTSQKVFQSLQIDGLTATCDAIVLRKQK